ncbi:MAG: 30S ribosomal protein S4 [Thermoplasmata archaeon]|nr:30S ribosomal protein S4 [Thermoplasmata archaeon]
MGDPKFARKKFETPSHPWEKARIDREGELIQKYGLKSKREIWKAETFLRKIREQARNLRAREGQEQSEKEKSLLIKRLMRLGLLTENAALDDVLSISIEDILSRRLQTVVYFKGLASTLKQARQFIVHQHIAIGNRIVDVPSYMVKKEEEDMITYSMASPLQDEEHPMRPKAEEVEIIKKEGE